MVVEDPLPLVADWFGTALVFWLAYLGILAAAVTLLSFLVSSVRRGPLAAAEGVYTVIATGVGDLAHTSPRRVLALAGLAFQEAIRRKMLLVTTCVFMVVLPLASWFLDRNSPEPAKLYLGFVLTASMYLSLTLALFLSVFSLPNDMANKTIYTVVTKPVRSTEIVLGRMLGFTAIGTILLGIMGVVSYVFVTRGLDHTHVVDLETLTKVKNIAGEGPDVVVMTGKTSLVDKHRHEVFIRRDGLGRTDVVNGHWHQVHTVRPYGIAIKVRDDDRLEVGRVLPESLGHDAGFQAGDILISVDGKAFEETPVRVPGQAAAAKVVPDFFELLGAAAGKSATFGILRNVQPKTVDLLREQYEVGPPEDMLTAREPVYGRLTYCDQTGSESNKAENVGNEWTYRQYIEGGTQAAAIWRFQGLTEQRFPREQFTNGLRLQMTLSVFRTHKGDIGTPVLGDIRFRNPKKKNVETERINFFSKEFAIYEHLVPWQMKDSQGKKLDLFQDLVDDDGNLEILVGCVDKGQYFGAAQADLYFLARQREFAPNFIKGYVGIWLQMVLIIGYGVMFSTFLNGAVAMLSDLFWLIAGMFTRPVRELLDGQIEGGLTFESLYRLLTHKPMTTELDPGIGTNVIKGLDNIVAVFLHAVVAVLPDLPYFSNSNYVAAGFDIPANNIIVHMLTALGYLLPLYVAAYFFLKTREVAK